MKYWRPILICLLGMVVMNGCVKKDFDEPPYVDESAGLQANATIAELKALYKGAPIEITEDLTISGVVVADDRSGNFFKSLVLQDETAGIDIQIERVGLSDDYPIGRRVFIKVKGLWLASNNGIVQLGAQVNASGVVQRIPDSLRSQYFFRGRRNQGTTARTVRISDLNTAMISTLIRLENVQFPDADLGTTLADAANRQAKNLTIEDCDGNRIILRTSGFAEFAWRTVPAGKGTLTAVYSVFGADKQLFIRELTDFELDGDRCGSNSNLELMPIADIRSLFNNTADTIAHIPDGRKIRSVVISDLTNSNITNRNCVVQDVNGAGIVIRFDTPHTLALGDEVEVDVSGASITEFQGLMQLNLSNSRARKIGQGTLPQPKLRTVAQILAEFEELESQLVRIENTTISRTSGNTYSGVATVRDASGTIDLYTTSYAAFASTPIATGEVQITAIVSQGGNQNSRQISIRNLGDITGGTNPGGDDDINQTFTGLPNDVDLALAGWKNIAEIGSRVWRGRIFSGNGYAQATAFNSADPANVTWMITPPVVLDAPRVLSFESAYFAWRHDGLEVFVSNDFNGTNVGNATWTKLPARVATQTDTENDFIPSGEIDLSGFSGTIHIAFRYSGTAAAQTTTYRVDNVVVKKK